MVFLFWYFDRLQPKRRTLWESFLCKLKSTLASWKGIYVSLGGRMTLLNSVLNSIPRFPFSFYKTPKVVIQDIIKIQLDFLWDGDENHKRINWVAWSLICKSKADEGLGSNIVNRSIGHFWVNGPKRFYQRKIQFGIKPFCSNMETSRHSLLILHFLSTSQNLLYGGVIWVSLWVHGVKKVIGLASALRAKSGEEHI